MSVREKAPADSLREACYSSEEATVLGVRCFAGSLELASERIIERVHARHGGYVCQANAHVLVVACHDDHVRGALDRAWTVHADGSPVSWLARRLGASDAQRIAGTELMTHVLQRGVPVGLRHYLFGSTPEVIARLRESIHARHPQAQIVGALSPPFGRLLEDQAAQHVETIRNANPDIVWCALGAPKQELWMSHYAALLGPTIVVGVGAAFEFHAGTKPRAPEWMQRIGLEWAHRFWSEPRRLAGRYIRTNSEFLLRAAADIVASKRKRSPA